MARCPNCGRETMRTVDWCCQWCGYPLFSGTYKKIDKTYKELKDERTGAIPIADKPDVEDQTIDET
jgi:ribosomal protein L37AE/L43A